VFNGVLTNALGVVNNSGVFTVPKGVWEVQFNTTLSGGSSTSQNLSSTVLVDGSGTVASYANDASTGISNATTITGFYVFTSDGTTTLAVSATYTSAAGTLVIAAGTRVLLRAI
jgi:hypothetical protein